MATLVKAYPKVGPPGSWKPSFIVDKFRLRRNLCRESYYDFCQIFWSEVIPEAPVWNWHMRIMAKELQDIAERVFQLQPKEYDLIFNVPPGSTKSTFGSILFCPWLWTRMPTLRFLNGSYDKDLSLEFGTKARRIIKSELYRETFPDIQIADDQDTKAHFANTMKGERRSTSTGAAIVGRHAHIQVIDDPIDPKGVRSEVEMLTANQWMTETLPSRVVDKSLTPLILIMQRLSQNDPTGERLARKGGTPVRHICLPAEDSPEVKPVVFRNKYKGGLLDPIRLPRRALDDARADLGNFAYSGQYEQRPIPLSGGMFQVEKFVMSEPPPPGAFLSVIRWWDKAASKEKWGAYTAGVLMGILKNIRAVPRYWILDVIRERWDTATRESMMRKTAEIDSVLYGTKYRVGLEQEPGSGGKDSNLGTIWNLAGFRVVSERPSGDKIARADQFSVQVNAGNVGMAFGLWNRLYIENVKYFGPGCKWKDEVDASSGAFNKLAKRRIKATAGGY